MFVWSPRCRAMLPCLAAPGHDHSPSVLTMQRFLTSCLRTLSAARAQAFEHLLEREIVRDAERGSASAVAAAGDSASLLAEYGEKYFRTVRLVLPPETVRETMQKTMFRELPTWLAQWGRFNDPKAKGMLQ